MRHPVLRPAARWMRLVLIASIVAACSHNPSPDEELDFRPDPVPVHVKNENFLDMNVAVVVSGVARRLGQVSGNGSADFKIPWSATIGQQVVLTATPIGSRGTFTSGGLSVGVGQVIEFHIASVLRQSIAVVREPN